jgi:hypothetical protein
MFYNASSFNQSLESWYPSKEELTDACPVIFSSAPDSLHHLKNVFQTKRFDADNITIQEAASLWGSDLKAAIAEYGHISTWNTSAVTDMSSLFNNRKYFNDDISDWDTSNVTNMSWMFYQASSFNQPLQKWNIDKLVDITCIFDYASSLNQPLDKFYRRFPTLAL